MQGVRDLHVDFELDDFAEFADRDVVRDVEAEKELAEQFLAIDHLRVDRFNDDC